MRVVELFSKRQRKILNGTVPDIYKYDTLPQTLREQFIYIISDALNYSQYAEFYKTILDIFTREHGIPRINGYEDFSTHLFYRIRNLDIDKVLDLIELSFNVIIEIPLPTGLVFQYPSFLSANKAVDELNFRFRENGVGYSFISGQIIRIDSEIIHENITKPTLSLLWNKKFQGANDEYLKAHKHYLEGDNGGCIYECFKSFESTIKIICTAKKWVFPNNATACTLIETCYKNKLIPEYLQNQFTSLRSLLESGIPTIRNKNSGHGVGAEPKIVDDNLTRYALNLTGSSIIFLIELSKIK